MGPSGAPLLSLLRPDGSELRLKPTLSASSSDVHADLGMLEGAVQDDEDLDPDDEPAIRMTVDLGGIDSEYVIYDHIDVSGGLEMAIAALLLPC